MSGGDADDAAASAGQAAVLDAVIRSRHSVRRFLSTPVPRETIENILGVASRAPSGTNTQPWRVHVLTGPAKADLSRKILGAYDDATTRLAEALADRLLALWDGKSDYERLSAGALASAQGRFHPDVARRRLEEIYERFA